MKVSRMVSERLYRWLGNIVFYHFSDGCLMVRLGKRVGQRWAAAGEGAGEKEGEVLVYGKKQARLLLLAAVGGLGTPRRQKSGLMEYLYQSYPGLHG